MRPRYLTHSAKYISCQYRSLALMSVYQMKSSPEAGIILEPQEPCVVHGTWQVLSTCLKNLKLSSRVGMWHGGSNISQKEISAYGFSSPHTHVNWTKWSSRTSPKENKEVSLEGTPAAWRVFVWMHLCTHVCKGRMT